jgi:polar amino acid transport system substrate-binding protein
MHRRSIVWALAALVALSVVAAGCGSKAAEQTVVPKIKPPAIGKAGVLRAVVDMSYPPFGGSAKGKKAGLDIDVASALAQKLGLKLEIVESTPSDGATKLRDGAADVMLGGVSIDQAVQLEVAFAGSYVSDAPAVFSTKEATSATIGTLAGAKVAAQQDSLAYWLLTEEYGEGTILAFPTLQEAFSAVLGGQADYAVGDGIVGSYMVRQFPTMRMNGQIAPSVPVGVSVGREAAELEQAVRVALDDLASEGVLETLRRKWLGDTQRFGPSTGATDTLEATTTP